MGGTAGSGAASGDLGPGSTEWPDNEFTAQLPEPKMKVMGAYEEDGVFTAAFSGATADDIKAYAQELKAQGFTVDAEEEDQNVMGMSIYSYTASNAAGYQVELVFANGTAALTVTR